MKALTFALRGQAYGLPIEPVREIIGLGEVTPVPMMPAYLRGVMNLRGSVVPVIDLAARLALGPAQDSERSCILIVECPADDGVHLVGVLVDAVQEVLRFEASALAAAPSFGTRVAPAFIAGLLPAGLGAAGGPAGGGPGGTADGAGAPSLVLLAPERVLSLPDLEDEVGACAMAA